MHRCLAICVLFSVHLVAYSLFTKFNCFSCLLTSGHGYRKCPCDPKLVCGIIFQKQNGRQSLSMLQMKVTDLSKFIVIAFIKSTENSFDHYYCAVKILVCDSQVFNEGILQVLKYFQMGIAPFTLWSKCFHHWYIMSH